MIGGASVDGDGLALGRTKRTKGRHKREVSTRPLLVKYFVSQSMG